MELAPRDPTVRFMLARIRFKQKDWVGPLIRTHTKVGEMMLSLVVRRRIISYISVLSTWGYWMGEVFLQSWSGITGSIHHVIDGYAYIDERKVHGHKTCSY